MLLRWQAWSVLTAALRVHTVLRQQALTLLGASAMPSVLAPPSAMACSMGVPLDDYFGVPGGSGSIAADSAVHTLDGCAIAALKADDASIPPAALVVLADAVGYRLSEFLRMTPTTLPIDAGGGKSSAGLSSAVEDEALRLAKAAQCIFLRFVNSAAGGAVCVDVEEVEPLALDLAPAECRFICTLDDAGMCEIRVSLVHSVAALQRGASCTATSTRSVGTCSPLPTAQPLLLSPVSHSLVHDLLNAVLCRVREWVLLLAASATTRFSR